MGFLGEKIIPWKPTALEKKTNWNKLA